MEKKLKYPQTDAGFRAQLLFSVAGVDSQQPLHFPKLAGIFYKHISFSVLYVLPMLRIETEINIYE